jgi:hypothetical protein
VQTADHRPQNPRQPAPNSIRPAPEIDAGRKAVNC